MASIGFLISLILAILTITDVKQFHFVVIILPLIIGVILQIGPYILIMFASTYAHNKRIEKIGKGVKKTGDKWDKLID